MSFPVPILPMWKLAAALWCALLLPRFCPALLPSEEPVAFPEHANVVRVTRPPYNAKGDGVTDDTAALQLAINENTGLGRVLYFPPGTYLVSATLNWPRKWNGRENWGYTWLQGQSAGKCVIRLKDGTFTDPKKPESMMWCGGFGSADWFHNHVQGLTFDVGKGNPGAVGLQFYSNNYGAVRDCRFVSQDGQGAVGLDLGHRDMNGPLLVRRVEVRGFRKGIATAGAVNSQTFEHITLSGQSEFGFDNEGQAISIRGLTSDNAVPAVRSYGTLCLLEARLTGRAGASKIPAIVNYNGGRIFLRDIALDDTSKKPWRRMPLAPPMPATLKLTKPVKRADIFIPNDGDEIVQIFTGNDTLPLAVPDRVMVVRLQF